jgi:diaminopimelate decarboxylase/aspartate kinase
MREVLPVPGSELKPAQKALLLAQGELLSSLIGSEVLTAAQLAPVWQDARNLLEIEHGSDSDVLAARCGDHADPALEQRLAEQGNLHITQGFIAAGPDGVTCLLGRGGSDTSAAYLAARLQAGALEIWTDVPGVPGIFSADPRVVPEARLLNRLSYSEAQELASMGARVLHPPSVQPARRHGIPVSIKDTNRPGEPGTRIGMRLERDEARVKGVVSRADITLISMENPAMWRQAGFLADAFAVFKRHGFSVDLISTSESTVTVSLDPQLTAHSDEMRMSAFLEDLTGLCKVKMHSACVSISLVGNSIRTILGRLSAALDVFQDRHVHMVTQSANDLNLTLVVDPEHAVSLVRKLHQLLIASQADNRPDLGPSWIELTRLKTPVDFPEPWWKSKADQLQLLMKDRESAYVYDLETTRRAARRLLELGSVSRVLYSVKANDHAELLRVISQEGLGFECVSMDEVHHVLSTIQGIETKEILFTPNFASRHEYEAAHGMNTRPRCNWVFASPWTITGRCNNGRNCSRVRIFFCGLTWTQAMDTIKRSLHRVQTPSSGYHWSTSRISWFYYKHTAFACLAFMPIRAAVCTMWKPGVSNYSVSLRFCRSFLMCGCWTLVVAWVFRTEQIRQALI